MQFVKELRRVALDDAGLAWAPAGMLALLLLAALCLLRWLGCELLGAGCWGAGVWYGGGVRSMG